MKETLLSLALLICSIISLFATCPTGPIYLNGQAAVDDFATNYPGCTTPEGLDIRGNISNLTGLQHITAVNGFLSINCAPGSTITNLNDLANLTSVSGGIVITSSSIQDYSQLNNLGAGFTGSLYIGGNSGDTLTLTSLGSFSSLTNLSAIGLYNIGGLTDLSAFSGLGYVKSLYLHGCYDLIDVSGVSLQGDITSIDLINCPMTSLPNWSGINSLVSLSISHMPNLTNLSGLNNLASSNSIII